MASKNHTDVASGKLHYYSAWSYSTYTEGDEEKTVYGGPAKTACYAGVVSRLVVEKAFRSMKMKKIDTEITDTGSVRGRWTTDGNRKTPVNSTYQNFPALNYLTPFKFISSLKREAKSMA